MKNNKIKTFILTLFVALNLTLVSSLSVNANTMPILSTVQNNATVLSNTADYSNVDLGWNDFNFNNFFVDGSFYSPWNKHSNMKWMYSDDGSKEYTSLGESFESFYSADNYTHDDYYYDDDGDGEDEGYLTFIEEDGGLFSVEFDLFGSCELVLKIMKQSSRYEENLESTKIYIDDEIYWEQDKDSRFSTGGFYANKTLFAKIPIHSVNNKASTIKIVGFIGFGGIVTDNPVGKSGTLNATTPPVIGGLTYSVFSNVENPFSFQEIIKGITAHDNTDGDITNRIEYETNYPKTSSELLKLQLGNYTVNASVSDIAGNTTKFNFMIYVMDINAPTWSGTTTYTQSNTAKLTIEEIKGNLIANDSFEGKIPSEQWELVRDNYTANYMKPGYYEQEYTTCDSSDNNSSVVIGITVKDTVNPVIKGPETITKNQTVTLTITEILSNYTATDDVDGDITDKIKIVEDNYTGNGGIAGNKTIKLSVSDRAENITTFIITVIVTDNIPPVYYLNQDTIIVSSTSPLSKEQMINILRQMEKIDVVATNFVTIESAYFDTPEIANTYVMSLKVKSSSGTEVNENMTIKVTPADSGSIEVKPKTKKPWYKKALSGIGNFFSWLIGLIAKFFKWLF